MDKPKKVAPKAFISYSWTTPEHEAWVLEWAERLRSDGVDVILDKWDFKEGHDKFAFMEQMVTDETVSKVIIFSDSAYAKKGDLRKGGVGTESQIISKEVYEKVKQEKFLPLVCEYEGDEPCLPTFFKSTKYLDFSSPEKANDNYEKLLRAIFDRPLHRKPPVGEPPKYLFDESKVVSSCRPLLAAFKNAVLNDKSIYKGLASNFLQEFLAKLEEFRIVPDSKIPLDELVVASIDDLLPFRDDFIEFASIVFSMKDEPDLYEEIADFFERSLTLRERPPENTDPFSEAQFDNFRFLIYELFLYVIALLIKYKRFNRVSIFLERIYLPPSTAYASKPSHFQIFCAFCRSLSERNGRLNLQRLSLEADFIKSRASRKEISFEQLKQADGICFLKSLVFNSESRLWMPHTSVYAGYHHPYELFYRGVSHKEFQKIAQLLDVQSKEDLLAKFNTGWERNRVGQWMIFHQSGVEFTTLFNFAKLDTV
ncbi:MAG: hypothetical protein JWQ71_991 [Pedosphaera sp.]|nr:hypothetical protein [Pedosphaera sp.]